MSNPQPQDTGYVSITNVTPTISACPVVQPPTGVQLQFKGVAGCPKCNGNGFKVKGNKQKPCKQCMVATGHCPKCNGTGTKVKDGKPCKCKTEGLGKKKDKKDKKDKKEKADKHK